MPLAPARVVLIGSLALAACGGSPGGANAAAPDSGSTVDAGSEVDSGSQVDSGSTVDGGSERDAAVGDAGAREDAGPPSPEMGFFVTSTGSGASGGDFGGLAGADARCRSLAAAVGAGGRTWRAYLSTSGEPARDRIGAGPWRNWAGAVVAADVASLHASGIASELLLDERGGTVPISEHDIVTGSTGSGVVTDPPYTCNDWTSSAPDAYAWVGHADWSADMEGDSDTWSSAHETPCDRDGMTGTLSAGRIYCFAAD